MYNIVQPEMRIGRQSTTVLTGIDVNGSAGAGINCNDNGSTAPGVVAVVLVQWQPWLMKQL